MRIEKLEAAIRAVAGIADSEEPNESVSLTKAIRKARELLHKEQGTGIPGRK